jgi:hypothetical protein
VIYPGSPQVGNATLVVANVLTCNKHSPIMPHCARSEEGYSALYGSAAGSRESLTQLQAAHLQVMQIVIFTMVKSWPMMPWLPGCQGGYQGVT